MKNDYTRNNHNRTQSTRTRSQARRSTSGSNVRKGAAASGSVRKSAAASGSARKSNGPDSTKHVRTRQSQRRPAGIFQGKDSYEMKLLMILALTVIVVVSVIGGAVKERGRAAEQAAMASAGESGGPVDVAESLQGTATDISIGDDEVTTAIVSLIRQYRAACASADVETIAKLYNVAELPNETTFMAVSSIIAGYQNTECYIREGLDDVSRVVFIYDDLKLADYDTLVPNLSYLYVRAAADGSFYIYPGVYNEETMSYEYEDEILDHIDNLEGDIEIAELIKEVNQKFSDTCDANKDIKEFIDRLIAVDSTSEKDKVKETSVETESETKKDLETKKESETSGESEPLQGETDEIESETGDLQSDSNESETESN